MKNYTFNPPFSDNIDILWKYINRNEISEISRQYDKFLLTKGSSAVNSGLSDIVEFFTAFIEDKYKTVDNLKILFKKFDYEYSNSRNDADKDRILIKFANSFSRTTHRKRKKDRKALKKYFDKDAATERYQKYVMSLKKQVSAFFRCLPAVLVNIKHDGVAKTNIDTLLKTIFKTLQKEKILRLKIDILSCLAKLIKNNTEVKKNVLLRDNDLSQLLNILTDTKSDTWEKCEVLNILTLLEHKSFSINIEKMLDAKHNDDIFVRRHSVGLLMDNISSFTDLDKTLTEIMDDPSAFVRQKLAESLSKLPGKLLIDKFYAW